MELTVSLLVTAGLSPVVRWYMLSRGVLDVPNHRSSHAVPIARGGGVACLVGVLTATAAAAVRGTAVPWVPVVACTALALMGFADDRLTLAPLPRLLVQLVSGAAIGYSVGGLLGLIVGAVVTAGVVNVVNFMDGINGITSLTMALWGLVALLVGRHEGSDSLALLGAVAAGAALGFLPWNAPTARLFLGDAGSYLFGGLAAAGLLTAWSIDAPVGLVSAPLAVYLADTSWALVRRARRGEKLTEAHREHVYQRLVSVAGLSHTASALIVAVSSALVTLGWLAFGPLLASLVTVVVISLYLGSVRLVAAHAAPTG